MQQYLNADTRIGKIVHYIVNNPWRILLLSLLVIAILLPATSRIKVDTSYRIWMHEGDPLLKEYDEFERKFGNDDMIALLVHSESGIFDRESVRLLQSMTDDLWQVHDVIRVDSLTNFNWIHGTRDQILVDPLLDPKDGALTEEFLQERKKIALEHDRIPGYLVSKDANTAVLYASIKPALVNYKRIIRLYTELDTATITKSSFRSFVGKLEQENSSQGSSYLETIKSERSAHYQKMIERIREIENSNDVFLHYDDALAIVKKMGPVAYTLPDSDHGKLEKLAETDFRELLDFLLLSQQKETANYEKIVTGVKKLRDTYDHKGDHVVHIVGSAYLIDSLREAMYADMEKIIPLVLLMILVFLFVTFKKNWGFNNLDGTLHSLKGLFISLSVIILSILFTFALMGLLEIKFTNITSMVPQILIAICIADSVHILVTFFQFIRMGLDKKDALRIALHKNFVPTLLTSLSTAIGFFSLSFSKIAPLAFLGLVAAFGVMIAWVLTYSVVGPVLAIIPVRSKEKSVQSKESYFQPAALSLAYTTFIRKYKLPIIIVFNLIIVVGFVLCVQLEVNTNPFELFKKGSDLRNGLETMEKQIGGAINFEIFIDSGQDEGVKDPVFLKKVEAFQQWVGQKKDIHGNRYVTKTISIIDIIKSMNKIIHGDRQEYYAIPESKEEISQLLFLYTMNLPQGMNINDRISLKNDALRMSMFVTLHDSKSQLIEFASIDRKAREMGLQARVTGKTRIYMDIQPYMLQTYISSIIMAIVLMTILLMIALRSVRLGLLAMLPNFMPLMLGAAFVKLLGYDLDLGHIMVFSICLGIAVDDTIHFLANHKENLNQGLSVEESIAKIGTFTAPALISTTVILVASFGAYMFSSFLPNTNFGLFTAFILLVALIADMLFLPALLFYTDKKKPQRLKEYVFDGTVQTEDGEAHKDFVGHNV